MLTKKPKLFDKNHINELTEKLFLVRMPDDFFHFWHFCHNINPYDPKTSIRHLLGLDLVGPFDLVDGKFGSNMANRDQESDLCYYRFYYDPPEFQTILREYKTNFHIGYFRDSPTESPSMVVSNDPDKSCAITVLGDNIFSALIEYCSKKAKGNKKEDICKLTEKLKDFAEKHEIPLRNDGIKRRKLNVVAKTFHGAGIVVLVKNDVGYRPIPETDSNLKRIMRKVIDASEPREKSAPYKDLQALVNLTNLANDECDFGMTLELGIDLFCYGHEFFNKLVIFLLENAYELLERNEFVTILKAHLKNRRLEPAQKFSCS